MEGLELANVRYQIQMKNQTTLPIIGRSTITTRSKPNYFDVVVYVLYAVLNSVAEDVKGGYSKTVM